MRRITVPLPGDTFERLRVLAEREMRDIRQQAAVLVLDGLERETDRPAARRRATGQAIEPEATR